MKIINELKEDLIINEKQQKEIIFGLAQFNDVFSDILLAYTSEETEQDIRLKEKVSKLVSMITCEIMRNMVTDPNTETNEDEIINIETMNAAVKYYKKMSEFLTDKHITETNKITSGKVTHD